MRWIIYDNVAFRQVDSEVFRDLNIYLSPRASTVMPSNVTVKSWIMKAYLLQKAVVKQELHNAATTKVHITFDLWTSGNCLSLNGVVDTL
jgi:hypothetical protein